MHKGTTIEELGATVDRVTNKPPAGKLTVICELYSREDNRLITSTEVQMECSFGAYSDNPFPASELMSAFIGTDKCPTFMYRVERAWGEA